jgi:hypothetical protein
MNGPHCLPVSLPSARIVLKHLANLIVFGRSVVKRSHGQKHERILDLVLTKSEAYNSLGLCPHTNTSDSHSWLALLVTGRVPPEQDAGNCSLARPVDGPPETALKGRKPFRTVKRLHPEGESK